MAPGIFVLSDMKIEIKYNRGCISFQIPDVNVAEVIRPGSGWETMSARQVFEAPAQKGQEFAELVRGRRVCVLLPDGTRDTPIEQAIAGLLGFLTGAAGVRFFICTGTHTALTEENERIHAIVTALAERAGLKDFEVFIHDCRENDFIDAGTTSRGTRVRYNAEVQWGEVFLAVSDIKPHYFAGYSNPVKNFVPGVCDYETARGNHALALDERSCFCAHPWHSNPAQQVGPLAEDQTEAMEMIVRGRPFWAMATISSGQAVGWAGFGPAREVCGQAFSLCDKWNVRQVEPAERMIVSPGGYPNDIDLYIAQRALELTKAAMAQGGEVLFVVACAEGIGPQRSMEHFWNLLTRPFEEIYKAIEGQYKLFSHKPWRFAQMIQRLRRLWVYSQLPDEVVRAGHMEPARDVQRIVDGWIKENPQVKILVVDGANKLALRAKETGS